MFYLRKKNEDKKIISQVSGKLKYELQLFRNIFPSCTVDWIS